MAPDYRSVRKRLFRGQRRWAIATKPSELISLTVIIPREERTDLAFTSEEEAFREEVRQFLRENVPAEMRRKLIEGAQLLKDEMVAWWRTLNKKGWRVGGWPEEYGGIS